MEPWQEEALLQQRQQARREYLPCCQCCALPITTERYLDLEPFGLRGCACEGCMERNLRDNEMEAV